MPGKLVSRMSKRECFTLSEQDTVKSASQLFHEKKTIFIEWPEKVVQFLPEETVWITIHHESDDTRTIDIAYEY